MTGLVRIVRALAALAALVGLVVGLPAALLAWGTTPWRGSLSADSLADVLAEPGADRVIAGFLTLAAWLVWALFLRAVTAELVATRRARRGLPVDRRSGPLHSTARGIVIWLTMTSGAFSSMAPAGATTPPPLASVISAEDAAVVGQPVEEEADTTAPPAESTPVAPAPDPVLVEEATSAWSFAEAHLGDGMRWRDLWDLNRDRVQHDGARWTDSEDDLQPGWTLLVPADAAPQAAVPAAVAQPAPAPPAEVDIQVASGDHFWSIAEHRLTEAWGRPVTDTEVHAYWAALVEANRDRLAPPHDPNLIYPGQVFTTPDPGVDPTLPAPASASTAPAEAAPAPTPAPDADAPPADPGGAGGPSTDATTPMAEAIPASPTPASPEVDAPGAAEAEEPSDDAGTISPSPEVGAVERGEAERPAPAPEAPAAEPATPEAPTAPESSAAPPAAPPTTAPEEAPTAAETTPVASTDSAESEPSGPAVPVLGVAATGLAVAVLRVLRRRRRRRAAQLSVGVVPPAPPREARPVAEEILAADEAAVDRLDAALANLCAGLHPRGGDVCAQPKVVLVTGRRVEVMLDRADPAPPAPWRPEASGRVWVLDESATVPLPDTVSPLPALVTVGVDDAELLIDLEAFGVVTITGDHDASWSLARSMVTELAVKADGTLGIELVGALEDSLANLGGVRRVGSWDEVDTGMIAGSARMLDAGRWPHTFAARASGRVFDGWAPAVWVTTPSQSERYFDAVEQVGSRPGAGTAIVIAADEGAAAAVGYGIRIVVAADGTFTIPELGLSGSAQLLAAEPAGQVLDLLDDAAHTPVAQTFEFPAPAEADVDVAEGTVEFTWPDEWPQDDDPEVMYDGPLPWPEEATVAEAPRAEVHAEAPAPPPSTTSSGRLADGDDRYEDPEWSVLARVCGEIVVEGGTAVLPAVETATATYLALNRTRDIEQIRDAIWGGHDVSLKRVRNVVAHVRRALGDQVSYSAEGRLETGGLFLTDLELIRRRLDYARHQSDPVARSETLRGALAWVTGKVCTYPAAARRSWTWVELDNWSPAVESTVGSVARDLATLCLELGDAEGAVWAASKGIDATGPREQLTILLVRGYALADDAPAAAAALRSYERAMDELGGAEHSEELLELLDRYLPPRDRAAS